MTLEVASLSLEHEFLEGQKLFQSSEDSVLSSNDPEFQSGVKSALLHFENVAELADKANIFSPNEELDDIRTDLLKYLMVPYYLGELHLKVVDAERLYHLQNAKRQLTYFLARCEKLKLVTKEELKTLRRDAPLDPSTRRAELIARVKKDKEVKEKLEVILKRKEEKQKKGNNSLAEDEDDELDRQHILLLIDMSIRKAIAQLELTEQELQMLETMEKMRQEGKAVGRNGPQAQPPSRRAPTQQGPAMYTILPGGRRVELQQQVFRPGHNLPTKTLEQALEEEVRYSQFQNQNQSNSRGQGKDKEEDADQDDEEALRKARAWDDFKDSNPRGWGNSRRS